MMTPHSASTSRQTPDFVSTDTAALASHMNHCASTRSRFFAWHAMIESAHALLFPRMVTAAVLSVVLLGVISTV